MTGKTSMPPSQREVISLLLLTALTVAPHFWHLDLRITLFFILLLLYRLLVLFRPRLQPGRLPLLLVTLGGAAMIFTLYPLLMGLGAKIALLSLMLGMKLLELRQRRDLYVVSFLCYFMLITQFLFDQGIGLAIYVFTLSIGITTVLVDSSRSRPAVHLSGALRPAGVLLLQATPIMLALFFLFPRFAGPLWHLGVDNSSGSSGLSDSITPGSISNLVLSRSVAFRVDFNDKIPPPAERYWRGIVLWHTDGWRWSRADYPEEGPVSYYAATDPINYSVTLEPSANPWLYALDLPDSVPDGATITGDFQLSSNRQLNQRYRYQMRSRLAYNTGTLANQERKLALQLPRNITPRMQQLVADWKRQNPADSAVVSRALQFFRQEPFYYTLQPPRVTSNPVDEFLFDSRRGFCEHYATSFVSLMRLAGIPARVVAGYQGGEINPLGDYLIVRQSDAHAWAEVWLSGEGWKRIDPTAAVAPERIERPFDIDLNQQSTPGISIDFSAAGNDFLRQLARQFGLGIDAANASWHRWILGYSLERQYQLMDLLGLDFLKGTRLALGMVLAVAILLALIGLLMWRRSRLSLQPLQRDYLRFCRRLSRRGITRRPHEGPEDFALRVVRLRPDLAHPVRQIIQLYIKLRYGPPSAATPSERKQLQRLSRSFWPGRGG